jgi:predicted pyridoxine 5'-phosphate oxidase superfamily flavin-nucleotide-binding protein
MSPVDIAFSPSTRAVQARKGSGEIYAGMEMGDSIDDGLAAFIAARDSFYLASASADGQPYIQHRGGPPGFLRVIDDRTLGFADLRGNRQYISTGNFTENPRAFIFLMDYAHRQRVKIWGTMRVIEDDPALVASLLPAGARLRPEAAMLFTVTAWDANCPAHIPQMFPAADVAAALATRDARIAALEAELAARR